jgi:hypothetical protein
MSTPEQAMDTIPTGFVYTILDEHQRFEISVEARFTPP